MCSLDYLQIFSESKDEIALVLFGTTETKNPLANGKCYENITIKRPMGIADLELLQMVQNDIQATTQSADCILMLSSTANTF